MKKQTIISSAIISLAILMAACAPNKYVGQYEILANSTLKKLDSVATVEQYNNVVTEYTSAAEELRTKYSHENFSQSQMDKLKELTASIAAKFFDVQAKLPLAHPQVMEELTESQITTN